MPVTRMELSLVSGADQTRAVEVWMKRQRKQHQYTPEMAAPVFGFRDGTTRELDRVIAPTVPLEHEHSATTTSSARVLRANIMSHQYRGVDLPVAEPLEGTRSPPNFNSSAAGTQDGSPSRTNTHGKSARELRWRMNVNRAGSGALGQTDKVTAIPGPDERRMTGQQMNLTMNAGHYANDVMETQGFEEGSRTLDASTGAQLSMMGTATLGAGSVADPSASGFTNLSGRRRVTSHKELAAAKMQHVATFQR